MIWPSVYCVYTLRVVVVTLPTSLGLFFEGTAIPVASYRSCRMTCVVISWSLLQSHTCSMHEICGEAIERVFRQREFCCRYVRGNRIKLPQTVLQICLHIYEFSQFFVNNFALQTHKLHQF
jgi:hypothetical protein